jgi:hypothetical protein
VHAERQRDREGGAASGSRAVTRPDGKTATGSWAATREEDGSHSVTGSRTGLTGRESSYAGTRQRNPDGSVSSTGTLTREDGRSATGETTRARTEDGWSGTGTWTTDAGKAYQREVEVTHGGGEATRTVTVTNPAGQTRTHSGSFSVE